MKKIYILGLIILCTSCKWFSAGTLGSFKRWAFVITEKQFEQELSQFFKNNPQYLVPEKWDYLDTWKESGYGFLKSKIFYFKDGPEEMYYVSYRDIDDDFTAKEGFKTTIISIRAVTDGNEMRIWFTVEDYEKNKVEEKRIDDRFHNEIISKLEKQMNLKSKLYSH